MAVLGRVAGPHPCDLHAKGSLRCACAEAQLSFWVLGAGTSLWDVGVDAWRQSSWGCMFLCVMWAWKKMVVVPGQEVGWRKGVYPTGNPSSLVWEGWKGLSPGPYWKPLKPAESFTPVFAFIIPIFHSFSVFISPSLPPPPIFISS